MLLPLLKEPKMGIRALVSAVAAMLLVVSNEALAQTKRSETVTVETAEKQIDKAVSGSRKRRGLESFVVLGNYSFFDLIIPSKIGLTAGYTETADTTWEIEYLRASLSVPFLVDDIGKMTDQRWSIIRRSFLGKNSFNFSYGLTYFDYSVKVGSEILNRLDSSYPGGLDLISLEGVGVNVGFGNRWIIQKNVTIGIDWLSLSQPVILTGKKSGILNYINNANDRKNVEKVIRIGSYFPRLAAIKLQLGISF